MQNISGIHAFEIKHFDRIVVSVKGALTSFIDAEDIGEITAKVLSDPDKHQNRGYAITGPEAIDYFAASNILSEELAKKTTTTFEDVMGKKPQTFRQFVKKNLSAWQR